MRLHNLLNLPPRCDLLVQPTFAEQRIAAARYHQPMHGVSHHRKGGLPVKSPLLLPQTAWQSPVQTHAHRKTQSTPIPVYAAALSACLCLHLGWVDAAAAAIDLLPLHGQYVVLTAASFSDDLVFNGLKDYGALIGLTIGGIVSVSTLLERIGNIQKSLDQSRQDTRERIDTLEKTTQQRIDALEKTTQQRIDDFRIYMQQETINNRQRIDALEKMTQQRIDALEKSTQQRIDDFRIYMQQEAMNNKERIDAIEKLTRNRTP